MGSRASTAIYSSYLVGESLNKDGDEQVEEDVVTKGHQGHEVERSPVARSLHPGEQHDIPVFLGQDLDFTRKRRNVF